MSGMSLLKTFGPWGGGSIFAWAQKRQHTSLFPGDHIVFLFLNAIFSIVIVLTFEPFLPRSTDMPNQSYSKVDKEVPTQRLIKGLSGYMGVFEQYKT